MARRRSLIRLQLEFQRLDNGRREVLRETNRLLFELREAVMAQITVTCVECGKSENAEDSSENIRDLKCKDCGSPMVVKRHPGNTKAT
jgi:DNA-directed RNA polymerase subunit RPC12/RpoP